VTFQLVERSETCIFINGPEGVDPDMLQSKAMGDVNGISERPGELRDLNAALQLVDVGKCRIWRAAPVNPVRQGHVSS
jgi:hypothetical protein